MDPDLLRSAVEWRDGRLEIIDQTLLPDRLAVLRLTTVAEVVGAIARLAVRGRRPSGSRARSGWCWAWPRPARPGPAPRAWPPPWPTWSGSRPPSRWPARPRSTCAGRSAGWRRPPPEPPAAELRRLALAEARAVLEEDRAACAAMAEAGRAELAGRSRLLTHCNTGRLATAGLGTALGVVYAKAAAAEPVQVLASETRPLLQGARLTAWELVNAGIPVTVVADTAAGAALAGGLVDAVLVGCDRVAANGDTANKIGTYSLAVLARANQVPFYVVGPLSSFDPEAAGGADIEVEQRPAAEVSTLAGRTVAPPGAGVWNPAFDVTPAALVTAFITDAGVLRPPFEQSIAAARASR